MRHSNKTLFTKAGGGPSVAHRQEFATPGLVWRSWVHLKKMRLMCRFKEGVDMEA